MYVVKNSSNETVALCTREDDAKIFLSASSVDKENYKIEKMEINSSSLGDQNDSD